MSSKLARHEAAQRELQTALEEAGWVVLSASTKAPCDLIAINGAGRPIDTILIEVKTGDSSLSADQRELQAAFPENFVKAHYCRAGKIGRRTNWEWRCSGWWGDEVMMALSDRAIRLMRESFELPSRLAEPAVSSTRGTEGP